MNIFPELKVKEVRWDVLVFGHLRWNRYFGETAENPPRGNPSTCGSVLLRGKESDGKDFFLIVDPTIRHSPEEYYFDLNRRTGLKPEAITHCFATHHHFDHWHGFKYFPRAKWLTGPGNRELIIAAVKDSAGTDPGDGLSPEIEAERIMEVSGEFLPGVATVPLPGHTKDLHGVAFMSGGKRILAAGDGVMTGYHFKARSTEFQSDSALVKTAAETIANIVESFDFVVPGHDNLIIV
jgi:glyoxylase-like metal-dependent hydrolase (beta-lactamase superfamily II)